MLSLVNLPELPHPGDMPLVARVLLGWFTVSAVVSPFSLSRPPPAGDTWQPVQVWSRLIWNCGYARAVPGAATSVAPAIASSHKVEEAFTAKPPSDRGRRHRSTS